MRNDYTLFWRLYPNGKKVVFYYTYNEKGERVGPWTTRSKTMTAARVYCNRLLKADNLIPRREKPFTFGEFAGGFWERGSDYLRNQEGRADITASYIENCRSMITNQAIPFFKDIPLGDITHHDINQWLLGFKNREVTIAGKTTVKSYKNTYANAVLACLGTMTRFAVEQDLITVNPCAKVRKLKSDKKQIEIITVEEARRLFPEKRETVWDGKELAYIGNRLASLTGMRVGEILGLRGEYVFDEYIYVCGSYGDYGYGLTKTKETRSIPLIPEMIALLKKLTEQNGKGYLFSRDGGAKPVTRRYLFDEFHRALQRIGVSREEIKRRGLTMHSWRHFLNTELQRQGLTVAQAQAVTGHKTESMTRRYSHLDARYIESVTEAQSVITGRSGLRLVPQAETENSPARKRA